MSKTVFLNRDVQKVYGDDTSFRLDLGQVFECKRISLNQFTMTNLFSNFQTYKDQVFSIAVGNTSQVLVSIVISQIHLTMAQLRTYIENQVQVLVPAFSMDWDYTSNYLAISATVKFTIPVASTGWLRLGFTPTQIALDAATTVKRGATYYNISQPRTIYINFSNLNSAINASGRAICFSLNNTSSFGSRISTESDSLISNQQIIFPSNVSFRYIDVEILNEQMQIMQTSNNNDTNQCGFQMCLSLYDQ